MKRADFGRYATCMAGGEEVRAFVPAPLPPHPPLELSGSAREAFDQALLALGRLDGAASTLPDADLLLYTYVRKEAVLSSQIEGTQSTRDDLLKHKLGESPGVPSGEALKASTCCYGVRCFCENLACTRVSPSKNSDRSTTLSLTLCARRATSSAGLNSS